MLVPGIPDPSISFLENYVVPGSRFLVSSHGMGLFLVFLDPPIRA